MRTLHLPPTFTVNELRLEFMKLVTQLKASKAAICGLACGGLLAGAAALVTPAYRTSQEKHRDGSPPTVGRELSAEISESRWQHGNRASSPISVTRASLGQSLYFDKRLSADGTVSCATCHDPAAAFASKDTVAIGAGKQIGTRNAPTVLNARFSQLYFWDGRVDTLEEQAKQPLLNVKEMGMKTEAALVSRVSSISEYRMNFHRVFPREGITLDSIAKALAAYERTLVSKDSPFDRFIAGDKNGITEAQKRGWDLFQHKAQCIKCHTFSAASPFFTDFNFHNTGLVSRSRNVNELDRRAHDIITNTEALDPSLLAHNAKFSDLGRFLVTKQLKDIGAFKTSSLRDVELTGPYMHDGSIKTLMDVVRFYNQGGEKNPYLDQKMQPLNLTDEEMSNLVEFLRALTSDDVLRMTQTATPQSGNALRIPGQR